MELDGKIGERSPLGYLEIYQGTEQNEASCESQRSVNDCEVLENINKKLSFVPSSLSLIIEYSVFFLNIVFVGILNDPVLMSGCGLGGMTANIVVFSVDIGICGGLDTLVSQAYGRSDFKLGKVYLNVCRIVVAMLFVPQLILLCNCEKLFVAIGQPTESAAVAWKYIMLILPGMFLNMQFECTRRYLLAVGVCNPVMYIFGITFIIHIVGLSIFVIVFELEIIGIGIATTITYSMDFILITIYTQYQSDPKIKTSFNLFDPSILKCLTEFLKYGVPACLMLLMEWWSYEIIVVYAGWLGVKQLAACSVLNNIFLVVVEIPYGISLTASCLVGNSLGSNTPIKARLYAVSTVIVGFIISFIISSIFFIFNKQIIFIYTSDEEELQIISTSTILFTIQLFECMFHTSVNGTTKW